MAKQQYFAPDDMDIDGHKAKRGDVVATLEFPDKAPLDNIVRGIAKGILTPNKPAPAQSEDAKPVATTEAKK